MKFFGREKEIKFLQDIEADSHKSAQLTVLTGRRRIGKTSLVLKAYEHLRIVYFFVSRKAEKDLCQGFIYELESKLGIPMLGNANSFADVFEYVMKLSISMPITIFIDEFQDFKYVNPSIFSDMQRIWDLHKENSKINLIVAGSVNTLMNELFRDNKQPLYQRETGYLKLSGFSPNVLKEILSTYNPGYTNEDLLALYSFTGGVAKYVELMVDHNIFTCQDMVEYMIRDGSTFLDEGKVMLIAEFGKEYGMYFSILSAIASGRTRRSEIEDKLGKDIGGYLTRLENDYELISKRQPIYERTDNKNVCYQLRDNFLSFWFRFIYKYSFMLEIKAYRKLREIIMRDYETFSGFMLERYFREILMEKEEYTRIGGWWDRKGLNEIDIVAADDIEHRLDFMEVKRNADKYRNGLLEDKIQAFLQVNKDLSSWERSLRCFSLKDL